MVIVAVIIAAFGVVVAVIVAVIIAAFGVVGAMIIAAFAALAAFSAFARTPTARRCFGMGLGVSGPGAPDGARQQAADEYQQRAP